MRILTLGRLLCMKLLKLCRMNNMDISSFWMLFLFCSNFIISGIKSEQKGSDEYCASESFDASCGQHEAILMESANYGRMEGGRCISAEYEHSIGCYADVMAYMDSKCSGRQTCTILIATLEAVAQPCDKDFKSYLQATYSCVPVYPALAQTCHDGDTSVNHDNSGYIATGLLEQDMAGLLCRWSIQVKQGQVVSLSLFAFDLVSLLPWDGMTSLDSHACLVTVNIIEGSERTNVDVCDIRQREKEIYVSTTNHVLVEISFAHDTDQIPHFLLKYKGVGCPDLEPTGNIWVKRKGDHLFLRCNETNQNWFLTCREDHWIGEIGNCSSDSQLAYEKALGTSGSYQRAWVVFAIIIGIVLGLLAGTGLLTLALMWRKRNKEDSRTTQMEDRNTQHGHLGKSSYPALLHQEKAMGGNISEYTHVWEMHPLDLTHDPLSDPTYVCRRHLCEYHQQTLNKEMHLQHLHHPSQRPDGTSHRSIEGGGYDTSPGTGTGPPGDSHVPPPPPPPHTQSGTVSQQTHRPHSLPPSTIQNTRNQLVLFDMESNSTIDSAHPRAAEL